MNTRIRAGTEPHPNVPETFYEFEIRRPDGQIQRIVISEEGQFCTPPSRALEVHVDPLQS